MILTDTQLNFYVNNVLKLPTAKKEEHLEQVDHLIAELRKKIDQESMFNVKKFTKCGSLIKGTALKPREGDGVDADVAVTLDVSEAEAEDIDNLHSIILTLLINVYPQKKPEDFTIQPRTLGVVYRTSGLNLDLVPVVPVEGRPGYSWQYSSQGDEPVVTCITGQIEFVSARAKADARFKRLVRMLKRWRNYQELEALRSFTIELLVAHLQDQQGPAPSLEDGLRRAFLFIAQNELQEVVTFPEFGRPAGSFVDPVVIVDPVNVDNNVAMRITDLERLEIVGAARVAWETLSTASHMNHKGETLDYWKELFGASFRLED